MRERLPGDAVRSRWRGNDGNIRRQRAHRTAERPGVPCASRRRRGRCSGTRRSDPPTRRRRRSTAPGWRGTEWAGTAGRTARPARSRIAPRPSAASSTGVDSGCGPDVQLARTGQGASALHGAGARRRVADEAGELDALDRDIRRAIVARDYRQLDWLSRHDDAVVGQHLDPNTVAEDAAHPGTDVPSAPAGNRFRTVPRRTGPWSPRLARSSRTRGEAGRERLRGSRGPLRVECLGRHFDAGRDRLQRRRQGRRRLGPGISGKARDRCIDPVEHVLRCDALLADGGVLQPIRAESDAPGRRSSCDVPWHLCMLRPSRPSSRRCGPARDRTPTH